MTYLYDPKRVTYFGMTDIRNQKKAFGIRQKDRDRHMYVIGKTGMGKSTLLENLAIQDIQHGEGLCFIDPHGQTAEKLLEYIPESRKKDVLYFAPFDTEFPIGFNVMEDVGYDKRHLVVSGLMSAFKRIWGPESWSARMEYILQNALLALLEYPDTTLVDVNRMLTNAQFRKKVTEFVTDPIVKRYWVEEFAGYTDRYTKEATPAIQNKIGQFVSNPLIRNIVAQPNSTFNIRELMDNRKIFIVNLSKGRVGETNADLLGSMIVVKTYLAAMSRAEETAAGLAKLPPYYLYVDEFQSVANDSFANILSEARKYKLSLTIAHQYIEQVSEEIQAAVFGNVGTTISFRVGPMDSEVLEKMFDPVFTAQDLVGLGFAQIYLTLMIDGVGSKPFSAQTLAPINEPPYNFVQEITASSQAKYGVPRLEVEKMLIKADILTVPKAQGQQQQQPQQKQQQAQPKQPQKQNGGGGQNNNGQQKKQEQKQGGDKEQQKNVPQKNNQSQKPVEEKKVEAPKEQVLDDHRKKLKEALEKFAQKEKESEAKSTLAGAAVVAGGVIAPQVVVPEVITRSSPIESVDVATVEATATPESVVLTEPTPITKSIDVEEIKEAAVGTEDADDEVGANIPEMNAEELDDDELYALLNDE
ncbi:MAG: type IV secretion system DNA-binding domain-containing protein [Minisyncoccia bacterium]